MDGLRTGKFIVFEGIDGSGKTTQITLAQKYLKEKGYDVYPTFEPTDGPVGKLIRQMLSGEVKTDQRTIACLFAADRTDHLMNEKNGIKNILNQGRIVLCDRYYFSSYAYHSQYIDMDWVIQSNAMNAQILKPDLTIFIDVDPETCFQRIKENRNGFEMYEKIDIMKKVRENYFKAFEKLKGSERVVIVDGNFSVQELADSISDKISRLLAGDSF